MDFANVIRVVSPFIPKMQQKTIVELAKTSEEREMFRTMLEELAQVITTMPVTYQQEGKGDEAIVYLHYFSAGCDWYITEKGVEGNGTVQAFGLADLGYGAEFGYISIQKLTQISGIELDLYWKPVTLDAIKSLRKAVFK